MIRTTLFALLAGTALAGATFAQTATDPDRPNPVLRFDQNGDGQITREEAQAISANPMARADTNGDGSLSRAEAVAAATQRAEQMFDRFDEDGDGQIALDDLPRPHGGRGHHDARGDEDHHGGEHGRMRDHAARGPDRLERLFERFDANDDVTLSADEIAEIPSHAPRRDGDRG